MASGFDTQPRGCQGRGCKAKTNDTVAYNVEEKQWLCDECATKKKHFIRDAECHEKWLCDKHKNKHVEVFCETHNICVCNTCAITTHRPCEVKDLADAVKEKKGDILDLFRDAEKRREEVHKYDALVSKCKATAEGHFKSIRQSITSASDDEEKKVEEIQRETVLMINIEADEDIKRINQQREDKLRQNDDEVYKQLTQIRDRKCKLLGEVQELDDKICEISEDLRSKSKKATTGLLKSRGRIEQLLANDKDLVQDVQKVTTLVNESLLTRVNTNAPEYVVRTTENIRLVREGGQNLGRIDRSNGTLVLSDTTEIPREVESPELVGIVSDRELSVVDSETDSRYAFHLDNKTVREVPEGLVPQIFLENNTVVCYNSNRNCITVCSREWEHLKDIEIPNDKASDFANNELNIMIDFYKDGMLLTLKELSDQIYVINPVNGEVVRTITVDVKEIRQIRGLSSGDIVLQTGDNELTVVSETGTQKTVIRHDHRPGLEVVVDRTNDTLYALYRDEDSHMYKVDTLSPDGEIRDMQMIEFEPTSKYSGSCVFTQSGKLVVCEGQTCYIYTRMYSVDDLYAMVVK